MAMTSVSPVSPSAAGWAWRGQAEGAGQLPDENDGANARGEAGHHGDGDEADEPPQPEHAREHLEDGHHRADDEQAPHSMLLHAVGDEHRHGRRGPAHRERCAAEQCAHHAGDDGRHQTHLRRDARGQRDGQ
jgi:hypothetical protein